MPIACVYCGASHPNPADVRACWQRNAGATADGDQLTLVDDGGDQPWSDPRPADWDDTPSSDRPPVDERPTRSTQSSSRPATTTRLVAQAPVRRAPARSVADGRSAAQLAGPDLLGRGLLLAPGGDVPEPWTDAEHIVIDDAAVADPTGAIERLRACWRARRRFVVEVAADGFAELADVTERRALHRLGPRFTLAGEELHHLATANSVDGRGTPAVWPLLAAALDAGAVAAPDGAADVISPGEDPLWLDGGSIEFRVPIDGVAVVHRIALEHGSLRPYGTNESTAADLAADQLAAVTHGGGAARIIAPAGSGKTRVLAERARHLLRNWQLPPGAVTLVAFNKRAQVELRERTADLPGLQVRTLNAIALAIVNGSAPFAPQPRQLRTVSEGDVRRLLGRLVRTPRKRNTDPLAVWVEALGIARLGMRDPDDVEAAYDGDVAGFAATFPQYRQALASEGALDFDEQIQLAIELLLADPTARAAGRRACGVLLVDEFQDLAPAHLLLVRLLAGPDGAVFGVGDDDQTIYGYNGADPAWLIDFADLFPGAGMHPLEVNYRCPGGVVEIADRLLRHNRRRVPKTIRSAKPDEVGWSVSAAMDGNTLPVTVGVVREALAAGRRPEEIAVLTRVNALLAPVQVSLRVEGIPVNGGVGEHFADQTSIRAALSWLRLSLPDADWTTNDLTEALRRPSRPLHPRIADWVGEQRSVADLLRLAARLTNERDAERVEAFAADIGRLQALVAAGRSTGEFFATLRDSIGLESAVANLDAGRRGMNRAAQNDDLTALGQIAALHPDARTFERWLRKWLAEPSDGNGVVLATVHRVKGLEWPAVIVHHADGDQFPHRLADDGEEERRLFHVALTRAIEQVTVVIGEHPSPFVAELITEPPERPMAPATLDPLDRLRGGSRQSAAPSAKRDGPPVQELDPAGTELFERLRAMRRELAKGKPAYTVFDDKTLRAIAAAAPTTLRDLAAIRGVGPAKLDLYGGAVLAIVEDAAAG
jgi:DNA helicase-2/ATP-dependent DNA helicase PcrA